MYFNFNQNTNFFVSSLDYWILFISMFRQQMASEPVSSSQFPSKQIDGGFWSFRSKIFPRIFSRQKSTSRHLLPCALVRKAHRLWAETGENSVKWRGGRFLFLCALSQLPSPAAEIWHQSYAMQTHEKNHVSVWQKLTDLEFRWHGIEWWIIYILMYLLLAKKVSLF